MYFYYSLFIPTNIVDLITFYFLINSYSNRLTKNKHFLKYWSIFSQLCAGNDQNYQKEFTQFKKYYNKRRIVMIKEVFIRTFKQNYLTNSWRHNYGTIVACNMENKVLPEQTYCLRSFRKSVVPGNDEYLNIPGLFYYKNFLTFEQNQSLYCNCLKLYGEICHNVNTNKYIIKQYKDSSGYEVYQQTIFHDLSCKQNTSKEIKYYNNFKGEGHNLAYFIGNRNIPSFITNCGLMNQVPYLQGHHHSHLNWRLILNIYTNCQSEIAFDWHKDNQGNGPVTYIFSLYGRSYLDMRKQCDRGQTIRLLLQPGSLLALSGQSRYNWEHRVVRIQEIGKKPGSIERVSVVLGYNLAKS